MWTLLVLCSVVASSGVQATTPVTETEGFETDITAWMTSETETTASDETATVTSAPDYTACGGYLYRSSGTFSSPNYPNNYPANADCIWYIRPGGTKRIVLLEFPVVNIEGHSTCAYDAIYVYDGSNTSSRLLGKICGANNATFHSTDTHLTVRFRSDHIVSHTGFHANYRVVPSCKNSCGSQIAVGSESCSCTSRCEYRGTCCLDYRDYCRTTTRPPSYTTTAGPLLTTTLVPEPTVTSAPVYTDCGGYLYSKNGTFSSPNYPINYPANADCIWYIRSGGRMRFVLLEFPVVNIESHSNCAYDAIYVYDGSNTSSRLLGKICGTNNATFYSTGSYMTVHFRSDHSVSRIGFHANYRFVPSCRNNCGYEVGTDVGSCSCSSQCEYRGNCCLDYRDYCTTTSQPSYTTTAQPSCRYNCGNHLGSCSCSSSCRYNGNCCHDYSYYCHFSTAVPTTAQPSCRYNCGWNMGSCSCSSSCRYNGNCCHDYYHYCPTTTPPPSYTTTAQPSCRYNCGNYLGSCSCSSSCRYNGNCCHDYYDYCYSTSAPSTTVRPCGGSLSGSGTFSSPNHPNYYHDNAYCTWQLRAPYDQRIFLEFTYLQLENCCSCDYIAVYDGPSVGSGYLGKVCNNTLKTFFSSSNYMTVLFRTDGSVVGRGFRAKFTNSLPPSSGRVDCSSDNMNIVIERTYLNSLGYDGHSLYLNDPYCRPQVSRYQVVFSFPINTCGNIRKFEDGIVVYSNTLRAYTSSSGEITRQSHLKLNVGCRMEQDSVSQIMYVVHHHDNSSITGTGRFNTSMDFYTSSSFYYKVTQVPYEVTLNQNLYVQVNLRRGDNTLVLFLDTCVASPSPHDFQTRSYYLVRNGCSLDDTYYAYVTGTHSFARFKFKAFQFLRAAESVYIQCKVLVCPASDSNSRCRRGCNRRVARDLGSEHDSQTVVLGPIKLKVPEKKEEGSQEQDKA